MFVNHLNQLSPSDVIDEQHFHAHNVKLINLIQMKLY